MITIKIYFPKCSNITNNINKLILDNTNYEINKDLFYIKLYIKHEAIDSSMLSQLSNINFTLNYSINKNIIANIKYNTSNYIKLDNNHIYYYKDTQGNIYILLIYIIDNSLNKEIAYTFFNNLKLKLSNDKIYPQITIVNSNNIPKFTKEININNDIITDNLSILFYLDSEKIKNESILNPNITLLSTLKKKLFSYIKYSKIKVNKNIRKFKDKYSLGLQVSTYKFIQNIN